MPFPYAEICTLLQRLEDNRRDYPLPKDRLATAKDIVHRWFQSHRRRINELDVDGAVALVSTFLPEWRTDRVYGSKTTRLSQTISRALELSVSNRKTLEAHKQPGFGDLGQCLERVLSNLGPPALPAVTVEEVDNLLQHWAGLSTFSDRSIPQLSRTASGTRDETFGNVLKRTQPEHGKWLARLILKNYSPVQVDDHAVLKSYHFLLPDLLRFQKDFRTAITILRQQLHEYPECPDPRSERLFRKQLDEGAGIRPVVGIKVSRPEFNKVYSIEMCLKKVDKRIWAVERKYDGEYCEVHIDLSRSRVVAECIKIFSKSGKDSTRDRAGIVPTLIQCLRLEDSKCAFRRQAILLCELVVFSDEKNHVMPFEEIRKHVTRSGHKLGTDQASQPRPGEHLAVVFFDLLLLDDEVVMKRPVEDRRSWLRKAYRKVPGRAMSAEWKLINFSDQLSKKRLVEQFAASNAHRCEGLVIKPCGVPYLSLEAKNSSNCIKLKKDYILGLGDEHDFAVIGGSFNAQAAATTGLKNIKWTSFHLGCLANIDDVRQSNAKPTFKHVGTIDCEHCVPKAVLEAANSLAGFRAHDYLADSGFEHFAIESTAPIKMEHAFFPPLIFEVLGSGYAKPSNCNFLMLRHPRVKKLHEDRPWQDCVSFQELQQEAGTSRALPSDSESQETRRWIERVERGCKAKFERENTISPKSKATTSPTFSSIRVSPTVGAGGPLVTHSITGLQTPLPSSGVVKLPNSPTRRRPVVRSHGASKKRSCDEDTVPHDASLYRKARIRSSTSHPRTPVSSSPLVELSQNIRTPRLQELARQDYHSKLPATAVAQRDAYAQSIVHVRGGF